MDSPKADADVDARVESTQKLIEVRDIDAKQVNDADQASLVNCRRVSKRTIGQPWELSWIGSLNLLKVSFK